MLNEESETPASSSNKRLTRPPQNWTLKNAFGRSFFGDSSSHSGSNTNRASLTKPKGRLFGSHAVHISDVAVHRVGSNSEDVPQEPTRSQRNTTRFSISTKKDNHQRDSILNALKKTRVGQLSYNKSPDNYKSVLSPPRSSSEIGESASSSLYASKHS
uniref:Uncharacterized protein n=1 Tax=Plectus sambesii TaxID=2011161 RepID=A0A914X6Y9_9BILA